MIKLFDEAAGADKPNNDINRSNCLTFIQKFIKTNASNRCLLFFCSNNFDIKNPIKLEIRMEMKNCFSSGVGNKAKDNKTNAYS